MQSFLGPLEGVVLRSRQSWSVATERRMPVRVLIVDDHEIVREGISQLITRSRPEWLICGQATNGEQAIELVQSLLPDVVVLDISMPKLNGLQVASKIAAMAAPRQCGLRFCRASTLPPSPGRDPRPACTCGTWGWDSAR